MIIGVPAEVKNNEYRVGMIPAGVRQLVKAGHNVLVQKDAGEGSGVTNAEYEEAGAVIVPTYGDETAARLACEGLATVFSDREIIALPSVAILSGGGSFHCITQQEPA